MKSKKLKVRVHCRRPIVVVVVLVVVVLVVVDDIIPLAFQIQLSQCKDRITKLEAQSEDPQDKSRVRILEGKDLLPGDMHKKIEDLEIHLAVKEEQLMEKLLLLEQVSKRMGI